MTCDLCIVIDNWNMKQFFLFRVVLILTLTAAFTLTNWGVYWSMCKNSNHFPQWSLKLTYYISGCLKLCSKMCLAVIFVFVFFVLCPEVALAIPECTNQRPIKTKTGHWRYTFYNCFTRTLHTSQSVHVDYKNKLILTLVENYANEDSE